MAGLAAEPVGKAALLEALAGAEGSATAVPAIATRAERALSDNYEAQEADWTRVRQEPDGADAENDWAMGGLKPSPDEMRHISQFRRLEAAVRDARSVLDHEEQRLRDLRRQAAKPGSMIEPSRLGYQEAEVNRAWSVLTQAEQARDAMELELHKLADTYSQAAHEAMEKTLHDTNVARQLQLNEVKRTRRIVDQDAMARDVAEAQGMFEAEDRQRRDAEARKHKNLSAQRLAVAHAEQEPKLFAAEKIRDAQFDGNAKRLIELKESTDRINRQMQASNEKKQKKQQKQKADQEQRRKELLDQGKNPYEVYRREEMEAEKERQRLESEKRGELRSEKLLAQLRSEEKRYKARRKEENQKRVEAEEFQKEMGNYAKEKKVAAYIRKMTIGNLEVLDPTGAALRIDPSKVTIQRTHAFGLGRGSMDEIMKVDRDVKSKKAMTATWKPPRAPNNDDLDDFVGGGTPKASTLGGPVQSSPGAGDEEAGGKLWVPKLSKLEEQYLAAARERQKQNITSVQRCWGKEFKGDAFLAKPSVIAFNDFEVGKKYRQVVEITNVSLTFNQFKLLPLDDRVKEYFEVDFVPPGRMSAGVTRYLTVWFLPKVSTDINSTFPILAKTGRIDFPLRCTTKKTALSISPQDSDKTPLIDFEQIIFAEEGHKVLQIKNSGALAATYKVEPAEDSDFVRTITIGTPEGQFGAHSTTNIKFGFKPTTVGDFVAEYRLSIDNGAVGDARFAEDRRVVVRGSCSDVPISVEKKEYDMKTCIYDQIFRENIVLHNRQQTAMKVTVERPKAIEGELQITPNLAFVQGHSSQIIQIKFSPKQGFLTLHPQFSVKGEDTEKFRIPFRFVGADQVEPVLTALVGTLTTDVISFEPKYLDFGRCFVGTSVACRVSVINESLLPQQIAFVRLPSFLFVADVPADVIEEEAMDASDNGTAVLENGGNAQLAMLLPQERRELCITYTPDAAMEMKHAVSIKAIVGSLCTRDYTLECRGQGVDPVIQLSHTQIEMASIPCNATTKESIVITNLSKVPYMINLLMPPVDLSALTASPVCCVLKPAERRRVQLEFKPTTDYLDLMKVPQKEVAITPSDPAVPADPAAPAPTEEHPPETEVSPEEHRKQTLCLIRRSGGRRWERGTLADSEGMVAGVVDVEDLGTDAKPERDGGSDALPSSRAGEPSPVTVGGVPADSAEGVGDLKAEPAQVQAERTVHASWRLMVSMRPHAEEGEQKKASRKNNAIYIGVRTCVLPTILVAEPAVLDFGEFTAGQRKTLLVTLHNKKPEEMQELRIEALPEKDCFKVLNAPRAIGDQPFTLVVEFHPALVQIYESTLRLFTQNTQLLVPLRGRGVRPVLQIMPENGILKFGAIVHNKAGKDFVERKLEILNSSPFAMTYTLDTVLAAESCDAGPSPFTLSPQAGVVEGWTEEKGNGKKVVTVTFRPHRPLETFVEKILVNVPNQKASTYVHLYGHCFQYQAYAIPYTNFGPFNAAELAGPERFVDSLRVGVGSDTAPDSEFVHQRAQRKIIPITFERGETQKFVLVGAAVAPGTPHAPVAGKEATFDFQVVESQYSKMFSVDVEGSAAGGKPGAKSLKPGDDALKAIFTYKPPPEDDSLTCKGVGLYMLSGVGQWITCKVKCILAGGYVPPPDSPDSKQEIVIELKAYLQQI